MPLHARTTTTRLQLPSLETPITPKTCLVCACRLCAPLLFVASPETPGPDRRLNETGDPPNNDIKAPAAPSLFWPRGLDGAAGISPPRHRGLRVSRPIGPQRTGKDMNWF